MPDWVFLVSQLPPTSAYFSTLVAVLPESASAAGANTGAEGSDAVYATPEIGLVVPLAIGYYRFTTADISTEYPRDPDDGSRGKLTAVLTKEIPNGRSPAGIYLVVISNVETVHALITGPCIADTVPGSAPIPTVAIPQHISSPRSRSTRILFHFPETSRSRRPSHCGGSTLVHRKRDVSGGRLRRRRCASPAIFPVRMGDNRTVGCSDVWQDSNSRRLLRHTPSLPSRTTVARYLLSPPK